MPFREWVELAAKGVEALAVVIMVSSIILGTVSWVSRSAKKIEGADEEYRAILGKTLLIGLGLLVAGDVIHTVAIDLTPLNVALLSSLVLVRTFLNWTLIVEVKGQWPWQGLPRSRSGTAKGQAPAAEPQSRNGARA